MFRDEKLELKVGLFIGVGIFLMFLIVFSISDFYFFEDGYDFYAVFDYVNGVNEDAPVRLAGVHVGEVKGIEIFYDDEASRTRVKVTVWVREGVDIERDAAVRINTLGLLGEQYIEITPGTETRLVKEGEVIEGRTPVNVGQQMESMTDFARSAGSVMRKIEQGQGTLGKLITEDTIYNDLEVIFGRLSEGEGTIGKLLVRDDVYDDLESFVKDIKAHPWKLLHKTSSRERDRDEDTGSRGTEISPRN
ncbi:MAG: MCE family protein [Candidatus Omnitrophica bacterium]|nr:MCE family protein [Candidatus Omnitrophota bacterium]